MKLDWESIRSSPRDGSSTSNWLTKGWLGFGGWLGVVGWVVGPQYFCVIPWFFENGASSKLMMFLLKMVDYSMSFLLLSTWIFFWQTSRGDHFETFLFSELFCGTSPSCFDDVLAEDGELIHVLPLAVHLKFFFDGQVGGEILKLSYILNFFVGPLL